MKKYLFVCKHNFARSKYAEKFFKKFLKNNGFSGKVRSAGVGWSSLFLGRRVSARALRGVSRVFVMEDYMKDWIVENFSFDRKNIVVLNIPDDYGVWIFKKHRLEDLDKVLGRVNWKKYV